MSVFMKFLLVMLVAFSLGATVAEAKRFGGGKSFGSKQSFSQSQKRDAQPAAPANSAAGTTQAVPGKTGAMGGGIMGMLGGLAIGGMIGALLFGGAFENINFLDIVIFGAIAFLLFKLFSSRKNTATQRAQTDTGATINTPADESTMSRQADTHAEKRAFDTDVLSKSRPQAGGSAGARFSQPTGVAPKDFDENHFIDGAKALYQRMQKAWDEKDVGDIRQFTTDAVFVEIQDQIRARVGDSRTEIVELRASLQSVREIDNAIEASVLFDASIKEYESAQDYYQEPVQVSEIWHFTKPKRSVQPTWYLDGIQQLSD